jgi:hypothetical protein
MPGAGGGLPPGLAPWAGRAGRVAVGPVCLLGVSVIALARPRPAEHDRRSAAGLRPVVDPALLDRLLDLPAGEPVPDPVVWAETSARPAGIVERGDNGNTVTRLPEPPFDLDSVVVRAGSAGEIRAVQDASLFAGFTWRWVACRRETATVAAILEAKVCGVGLLAAGGRVILEAEPPRRRIVDGWGWLLEEKAYRCWLGTRPRPGGRPGA